MAADGVGQIFGSQSIFQVSGSQPVVLPIDSSAYLSNITIAGNTFQFASTGQQLLSTMLKPASGPGQANYTLQIYNNTTGAVVSTYTLDAPGGGVGPELQTIQMVLDVLNVLHTFSLRVLINSGSSANAMQLLGPVFQMVVTPLGSSGSGTVSGTTNYIAKFTAPTVVGDSGFKNTSGAILEAVTGNMQLGVGNYPVQVNFGGSDASFPALAAQSGGLVAVTADGLGTIVPFRCSQLTVQQTANPSYFGNVFTVDNAGAGCFSGTGFFFGPGAFTNAYISLWAESQSRLTISNGDYPKSVGNDYLILGADLSSGSSIKVPDATAGAGNVLHITGSNAFATSGLAGGNILLEPGTGDGAGANGKVICQSIFTLALSAAAATIEAFDGTSVPVSVANSGRIRYNNTTKTFQVSLDTGAWTSIATGAGLSGSGTSPLFSRWSSSSALTSVGAAPTTADALADGIIGTSATTQKALVVQGKASQTANVIEAQTSTGVVTFAVPIATSIVTGVSNQISGSGAGLALTSGARNTMDGSGAGVLLSTASDHTFIGYQAGASLTTGGDKNVFVGGLAGKFQIKGQMVAVGYQALQGGSTAASNLGANNTAVGYQAMANVVGGDNNACFGFQSGNAITGVHSTSGLNNTLVGNSSGSFITTGSGNTGVGGGVYPTLETGSNNTVIGYNSDVSTLSISTATILGASSSGAGSCVIIGSGITSSTTNDLIIRSGDSGFSRVAANVIKPFDGTNNGWLQQAAGSARVTSQFDKTTNVTLAGITGLSWTLTAGRTYSFEIVLITTCSAAGGLQVDLNGGSATATTINITSFIFLAASSFGANGTALNTVLFNTTGAVLQVGIRGTITVNAGGTFIPRFAQSVASGTSSVLVGSFGWLRDMP